MGTDEDRDYHTARAQAELDSSYRPTHRAAAEAHKKLSAMHMQRAQAPKTSGD